jgi:hypothetical protein
MGNQIEPIEPAEAPSELSDEKMADQFAALAVKVVMKENAEKPVLSSTRTARFPGGTISKLSLMPMRWSRRRRSPPTRATSSLRLRFGESRA